MVVIIHVPYNYSDKLRFYGFDYQFFPPDTNEKAGQENKNIANKFYGENLKDIIEKINENTGPPPSFVFIGYGQSGSGKTNTG